MLKYKLFIEELKKEFTLIKKELIRNWKNKYFNKRNFINTEIIIFSFKQLFIIK